MSTLAVDNITNASGGGAPLFPKQLRAEFYLSPQTITANYTVAATFNAMTAGPVEVANGVTVEVANGSTWSVI